MQLQHESRGSYQRMDNRYFRTAFFFPDRKEWGLYSGTK